VKFLPFLLGNLLRNRQRTVLTIISVMVAFLLLCVLVATNNSFDVGIDIVGKNRLLTRNQASWTEPLPLSYYHRLKAIAGTTNVTHITSVGGYYQEAGNAIASLAVDGPSYLEMNPEIEIAADQREAWLRNRAGVIVGAELADRFGWQLGDQIPLQSSIWRHSTGGNVWEVVIAAVYRDSRTSARSEALFMHYAYLNDARAFQRDTVSVYQLLVADPDQADAVASRIDSSFGSSSAPTKTASELGFARELTAQFANMGAMVLAVAGVVFFTLLLTTASTLGRSVRERAGELAVLRVIGFRKLNVMALVMAESMLLTSIGGLLGVVASLPLIAYVAGQRTAAFSLTPYDIAAVVVLVLGFGCLAGFLPGCAAVRGSPVSALKGDW
jgi:putative ABC transport system permease protein